MSAPRTAVGQIFRAVAVANVLMAFVPLVGGLARRGTVSVARVVIVVVVTVALSGTLMAIAHWLDRRSAVDSAPPAT